MPRLAIRLLAFAVFTSAGTLYAQNPSLTEAPPSLLEQAFELDEGKATPRDAAAAAKLYAQAAATGEAFAHLRLGYLAESGDGMPQDYTVARSHYQAAVDAGLKEAHVRLAVCHLEGWGGPVDRAGFAREIRAGAEAGDIPAQRILASMYFTGIGVAKNEAEGVRWLEAAASAGDAEAQINLGQKKESLLRRLAASNLELAQKWYLQSAEQEYLAAMRAMARTFLHNRGENANWSEAKKWLVLASEGGDAEAPFILAACELLRTKVGAADVDAARTWFEVASARGNSRATEVLELEVSGRPLAEAARYVLTTPFEDRYVQSRAAKASDAPTQAPVPYRVVKPIYPRSLSMTGIAGTVVVDFVVNTKGVVTDVKVTQSAHPLFSDRAVEAVRQWRFHPGRKDNHLVNTRLRVPVQFSLEKEELRGIDQLLSAAYGLAEQAGPAVAADAKDIRPARPLAAIKPAPEERALLQGDLKVMLLLVLDEAGKPVRGHVLQAEPAAAGETLLRLALANRYQPRELAGEKVASNVVLPFLRGKYLPQAGAANLARE